MRKGLHRWLCALLILVASGVLRGQGGQRCFSFDDIAGSGALPFPSGWNYYPHSSLSYSNANLIRSNAETYLNFSMTSSGRSFMVMPNPGINDLQGWWMEFYTRGLADAVVEVGWLAVDNDTSSFQLLESFTTLSQQTLFTAVDLSAVPLGGRRLAFAIRRTTSGLTTARIQGIRLTQTPCVVKNFHLERADADSMVFAWEQHGSPITTLLVQNIDDGTTTLYEDLPAGRFAVPRQPDNIYQARISAVPDTTLVLCGPQWIIEQDVWVPLDDSSECVDISKRFSSSSMPYVGTFQNPYQTVGLGDMVNDYNWSRHYLNLDTTAYDPQVGPALRVIPPGETMSLRLGNWLSGAQAEAMVYTIPVDTTRADMLILKYAAVMEDPNHDVQSQPRFRIEMLDAQGGLIAPASCNSYDFVASPELGWNTIPAPGSFYGSVLWKDWTIVGIDLSAYHGQTVRLRLTTFDCNHGGHFGYAYYTLACATKTIEFLSCSLNDSNLVAAPEGFTYSWHRDDSPTVVGNGREIKLPVDNHIYYCDLGFIGDPSCSVTMSVLSRQVSPVARFSHTVEREGCRFRTSFHNESCMADDSLRRGDYTRWVFDDTLVLTQEDPVVWWDDSGTHRVVLLSALDEEFLCVDSAVGTLRLDYAVDSLSRTICRGDTLRILDTALATPGVYHLRFGCDTIGILSLAVLDTTLTVHTEEHCVSYTFQDSLLTASGDYRFVYPNAAGCDSTHLLHLTLYPEYELSDTLRFCAPGPYVYRGVDFDKPRTFDTLLFSVHGCDSLAHVTLETQDSLLRVAARHSIDGRQWADTVPIVICSNQKLYLRDTTTGGAVAWRWALSSDGRDSLLAESPTCVLLPPVAGRYDIGLQVTSLHGCHDSLLWPLLIVPAPEAEFGWEPMPFDYNPTVHFLNFTMPAGCEYQWLVQREPGVAGMDTLFDFEPTYNWGDGMPRGAVEVTLMASSLLEVDSIVHRCIDTVTHTVQIFTCYLQFPNLVTPNGDGTNDRWEVVGLLESGLYSMNELWIYNAWGAEVYHVRDIVRPDQFWDPTDWPDGTYYYRFAAQGPCGLVQRNGLIEVVR